jgi:hypothetical protein
LSKQPWIYKTRHDLAFICLPPFYCLLAVLAFPRFFTSDVSVAGWWWVALVLLIDVSHVYTTLYRTYFDKTVLQQHRTLLTLMPLLAFILAFLLYALGTDIFWRLLAYVAVFHFVRQQYGFVKVYNRKEEKNRWQKADEAVIYAATLYPLLYWHCYGPFEFTWFVKDDFMMWRAPVIEKTGFIIYILILLVYMGKEAMQYYRTRTFNWPRNLVIAGTIISWYGGIVYLRNDMGFTLFNVVTHGIPYMALVWMYGRKQVQTAAPGFSGGWRKWAFSGGGVLLFLLVPFALAFLEEGLWDTWIWDEKREVFGIFSTISFSLSAEWKQIIVPLLILPQLTHYMIDGFIWKVSKGHVPDRG